MGEVIDAPASNREVAISRLVIDRLFRELGELSRGVEVRLWNGDRVRPTGGAAVQSKLILRHPGALRAMLWPPSAQTLASAYVYDDFDVEGALEPMLPLVDHMLARSTGQTAAGRNWLGQLLLALPDVSNARRAGRHEPTLVPADGASLDLGRNALLYRPNLGNAFYACWLGRGMSYLPDAYAEIEQPDKTAGSGRIQREAVEQLCARLDLRPDETLLDLSAGWGSLVIQAARHHGVQADGICQSSDQLLLAEQRAEMAGLDDRCRFWLSGIDIFAESGWNRSRLDKIVELGLGDHVDASQLADHFAQVRRMLRPGGLYLYQGLTRRMGGTWGSVSPFVDSFVLPVGELVPISTLLEAAEQSGLEVREVGSIRQPYLQALRSWLRRLEEQHREIEFLAGERVYRAWRLYLAATAYGLAGGQLNVYEAELHRPGSAAYAARETTTGGETTENECPAAESTAIVTRPRTAEVVARRRPQPPTLTGWRVAYHHRKAGRLSRRAERPALRFRR